ncbi:hypothetical protein EG68_05540 [Paragonimus skrjabini miyazakii]|uniref:Cilia- and flagella-associated protein 300 n=1 Tax=Paragonimus skrjabini miyazakii TaxID=59628 RepID=A0A8S9YC30_9TREM|nr:hypothetical protein EG68_05540 [Paragonimus skrjabini miyazakii]
MTLYGGNSRNSTFTFIEIQNRQYPSIHSKEAMGSLMKWSMKGRLKIHTFSFDENFKQYDAENFMNFLLDENSELSYVLTEKEKSEFLYKIFFHLSIGGELCQNEDNINEYAEFARKIYRDIISVQKNAETKELQIVSLVYKVRAEDESGAVFPSDVEHVNTFAYVIVDPFKRNAILLHHVFGCGEF